MRRALMLVVLMLPACADSRRGSPETETPSTESPSTATPAPPATDRWTPAKNVAKAGDIQVTVTQAGIEPIHVSGAQDRTDVFAVRLSLDNTSSTKRLMYRTWAANAVLVDNFGNYYKRLPRPSGAGVREVSLNPTSPVNDVLFLEAPIATAGHVDLRLPGENIGVVSVLDFRLQLQTSGARLEAVKQAAAAFEADANAKATAIAAREAAAKRAEEAAKRSIEEKRLAAEERRREAEERRRLDELAAEKEKREAQRKKEEADREAEIVALPGKLASARRSLEDAEEKMKKIKAATSRYPFPGATAPDDFFDTKGRYIYYLPSQKTKRTTTIQEEIERLNAEIVSLEARLKALKK